MKLISANWFLDHGDEAVLGAQIEYKGTTYSAEIDTEQKLLNHGLPLVFLGPEWVDRIPKLQIIDGYGSPLVVEGFTRNSEIVKLTLKFLRLIEKENAKPGPLK